MDHRIAAFGGSLLVQRFLSFEVVEERGKGAERSSLQVNYAGRREYVEAREGPAMPSRGTKRKLSRKGETFKWKSRAQVERERVWRRIIRLRTEDVMASPQELARQAGVPPHVVRRVLHDPQEDQRMLMCGRFELNEIDPYCFGDA
jgi:hypothetical protein